MTTITLNQLTKKFTQAVDNHIQQVPVVDHVSLKIASGSVMAVLGPSGCGKSTLLRLIAGLIPPDSGEVLYDDVPLREVPLDQRGIGMVFQDGALIPHWDSRQNIGFFLWLRKREHEVPARVARISQITGIGLEKLLDRRPHQLSGGERQRVGIARALARDPRVFLFDEPFSNLDAKLRTQARVELKRLLHEFPVTSLYVTHDQVEAVALADRVAVMRAGRIEQVGPHNSLYRNPVNLFVATFIGTPPINLFEGEIRSHQWHGENFGGYPVRADLPDGLRIIAAVRPESVRLVNGGVKGVVDEATPHYGERMQVVELRAGRECWRMQVSVDEAIGVGDTLHCALDEAEIMYFDPVTEQRIG